MDKRTIQADTERDADARPPLESASGENVVPASSAATSARFRTTLARISPAIGLFFLAPLVAEFLLGNIAIDGLAGLIILAPLYGGGAVLIRESVRRAGRGWPSIVLLALAYGIFEEGLVTQSLFDPNYVGADLLRVTFVPALGIGVWWTLFVLTLHTVWSISVPIALVEALTPRRRTTPWLGPVGLIVTALLFVLDPSSPFSARTRKSASSPRRRNWSRRSSPSPC